MFFLSLVRRFTEPRGDPTILAKCAEFFMQHEQHDKASWVERFMERDQESC